MKKTRKRKLSERHFLNVQLYMWLTKTHIYLYQKNGGTTKKYIYKVFFCLTKQL